MDSLKKIISKANIHHLFRRMLYLMMALLICSNAQHADAQTITVTGMVLSATDSTTMPFATILIYDSSNKQLGGTTSDFDGKFTIKIPAPSFTWMQVSAKNTCCYEVLLDSVRCENVELNIYLQPVPCPEKTQADCPLHTAECDVVPIVYMTMFDKPSKKIRRDKEKGLIYIKQRYNDGVDCCPKHWYCKKHQVEF
ncbi:MAG TPA: hypothetical protein PLA88_04645 [Bacteroidales bacterium]|nr:hypothetical protein [Bacteroidales bacterium]